MSNEKQPIVFVYYRDIPAVLLSLLSGDDGYSYTKDGVMKTLGHSCPRMTIRYELKNNHEDAKVLKKLEKLLNELESNNQIVSFSFMA